MENNITNSTDVEIFRQALHNLVDAYCNLFIKPHISASNQDDQLSTQQKEFTHCLSLDAESSTFKSTKPVSIVFPNGKEVYVKTWKQAVAAILTDCNSDEEIHSRLVQLSGKIFGKVRTILGNRPESVTNPLKVTDNLYPSTQYDTETLLNILKNRILDEVGYNYQGIMINYRPFHRKRM